MNKCQSCGMPMEVPEDFGGGNTMNQYCRYCTDEAGNLLPREVVKEKMTNFYIKAMNSTPEEAAVKVDQTMASMPAWQQATPTMPPQTEAVPTFNYEPAPVLDQAEQAVSEVIPFSAPVEPQIVEPTPVEEKVDDEIPLPPDPGQ